MKIATVLAHLTVIAGVFSAESSIKATRVMPDPCWEPKLLDPEVLLGSKATMEASVKAGQKKEYGKSAKRRQSASGTIPAIKTKPASPGKAPPKASPRLSCSKPACPTSEPICCYTRLHTVPVKTPNTPNKGPKADLHSSSGAAKPLTASHPLTPPGPRVLSSKACPFYPAKCPCYPNNGKKLLEETFLDDAIMTVGDWKLCWRQGPPSYTPSGLLIGGQFQLTWMLKGELYRWAAKIVDPDLMQFAYAKWDDLYGCTYPVRTG